MDFLGERYAGRRFLRVNELIELGIVDNRSTLKTWVDRGRFPAPIRRGKRGMLFAVYEIAQVLATRAGERAMRQT
jgi:predicted DNA-binding transcriptional regulator AlpA